MRPMFAEYPGVPGLDSFDEFMKMVRKILALIKNKTEKDFGPMLAAIKKEFRQGYNGMPSWVLDIGY